MLFTGTETVLLLFAAELVEPVEFPPPLGLDSTAEALDDAPLLELLTEFLEETLDDVPLLELLTEFLEETLFLEFTDEITEELTATVPDSTELPSTDELFVSSVDEVFDVSEFTAEVCELFLLSTSVPALPHPASRSIVEISTAQNIYVILIPLLLFRKFFIGQFNTCS